jgi:hypothetical protein
MDKNSMSYWFPITSKLNIPQPRTVIIPIKYIWDKTGNYPIVSKEDLIKIKIEAGKFNLPLFIRGSHASAKHDWRDSCYIERIKDLGSHITSILEFAINADIVGIPCDCIAIREFIEMDTLFTAFRDMPVNPEIRYFVRNEKIICHHWYWIEDVFIERSIACENWRDKLKESEKSISKEEYDLLDKCAAELGLALKGDWSLDFCRAKDRKWYFIDCAFASISWHDENCPFYDLFIPKEKKD